MESNENSELLSLYISILQHSIECVEKLRLYQTDGFWNEYYNQLTTLINNVAFKTSIAEDEIISAYKKMQDLQSSCYSLYIDINSYKTMIKSGSTPPFTGQGVIYTCITGNYDAVKTPSFVDSHFDYILLTDQKDIESDFWKVKYIDNTDNLSSVRLARKHKILSHNIFPEYDFSIYIDGKVQIIGDIYEYITKYSKGSGMLCFPHFFRDCIKEELAELIKLDKDKEDIMIPQVERYLNEGFPEHYGLVDTCVLVRNHRDTKLNKVMETWWNELSTGSHRDQLSFTYSCWKHNYIYDTCNLLVMDNPYACAGEH